MKLHAPIRRARFGAGLAARPQQAGRRRASESGYALLIVVFFAAVMLIAAAVAAPRIRTQGLREKEDELIWRGEQHVRAIRLYYRKYGRFPKSVDELYEKKNNIRFLRKPYKDPMNGADGAWRFIYVGAGGQLIGSLTRVTAIGLPQAQRPPVPTANVSSAAPPAPPPPRPRREINPAPDEGNLPPEEDVDTGAAPPPPPPEPPKKSFEGTTTVEGKVFGGNLIGIASKVNKRSLKFYNGYGKYKEWEFIWDPLADTGGAGGLLPQTNVPPGAPPSQTPPPQTTPPSSIPPQ